MICLDISLICFVWVLHAESMHEELVDISTCIVNVVTMHFTIDNYDFCSSLMQPLSILCRSLRDIDIYTTGFPRGDGQGHANIFRAVKHCLPGPVRISPSSYSYC